ncbi:MAG: nucleotidyl transferase AbiEii/AbiGii toxin family protein [archaeon]
MIERETIEKLAKVWNAKPWQQEKHYLQSAILSQLGDFPLVFKGGTYLWFFHGLERFSEDLDFTLDGKFPADMNRKVSDGLKLLEITHTIKVTQDNPVGFSFRISAKGPLYKNENSLCHVYVEISKRENILDDTTAFEIINSNYLIPSTIIRGMSLQEVAAEKVRAIMSREKPRDVYDLAFLIKEKKILFDEKFINHKMEYYNEKFDEKKFMKKLEQKRKDWKKEMNQIMLSKLPPFDDELTIIRKWVQP